jgi:hypothetical protein
MSLIGKKSAIVSLGSSCQAAHQIRLHAQLLSEAMGDELVPSRLPFDWTIASAARAATWLAAADRFPCSPGELLPVDGNDGAFLWPKHGIYFWHDFRSPSGIDVAGTFDRTREMYERQFLRLRDLGRLEKIVVVVANTQNNLTSILPSKHDLIYSREDIVRLKTAFESMIGRPCRMLCVTNVGLHGPGFLGDPALDITVRRIPRAALWQGNPSFWQKIFQEYFA